RDEAGGLFLAGVAVLHRRIDEADEERMRRHRPGLELGVRLDGEEVGVLWQLDDLHAARARLHARDDHPRLLEALAVFLVELVAVAKALRNLLLAVERASERPLDQSDRMSAEPHPLLVGRRGDGDDDRMRRALVELER